MRQWVDRVTGEVVLTEIHLWPRDSGECALCGEMAILNHAVAYYCGPTHDEIGSISTKYRGTQEHPAIVGGMPCCKVCHDEHYSVTRPLRASEQVEYPASLQVRASEER